MGRKWVAKMYSILKCYKLLLPDPKVLHEHFAFGVFLSSGEQNEIYHSKDDERAMVRYSTNET